MMHRNRIIMKAALYALLGLATLPFSSSAAIVISSAPGGNLTFAFDSALEFETTSSYTATKLLLVFPDVYASAQPIGSSFFAGDGTISISGSGFDPGTVAAVVTNDVGGSGPNDLALEFQISTSGYNGNQFDPITISAGTSATVDSSIALPSIGGSLGLYLINDGSGAIISDTVITSVSFVAVPEPSVLALGLGAAALGLLAVRRRR